MIRRGDLIGRLRASRSHSVPLPAANEGKDTAKTAIPVQPADIGS